MSFLFGVLNKKLPHPAGVRGGGSPPLRLLEAEGRWLLGLSKRAHQKNMELTAIILSVILALSESLSLNSKVESNGVLHFFQLLALQLHAHCDCDVDLKTPTSTPVVEARSIKEDAFSETKSE